MHDPTQRPRRRPRLTILGVMLLVALAAGLFAWERQRLDRIAAERAVWLDGQASLLKSKLVRAKDRADWSAAMHAKGFITAKQLEDEKLELARLQAELAKLAQSAPK